jgi:hypothetical protein
MEKKGDMLEVGTIKAAPLARFGRNQRRAALLAPRAGKPAGVIRFRTWDEFASWQKKNLRAN